MIRPLRCRSLTVAVLFAIVVGCAHPAGSFRLVPGSPDPVLIPPGVKDASAGTASVRMPVSKCSASPDGFQIKGRSLIFNRDSLIAAPPGELDKWAVSLEKSGCITASALTTSVIDSLPLDLAARRRLRGEALVTNGSMNLSSFHSLRVVAPVYRPVAPASSSAVATNRPRLSGEPDRIIDVVVKANPDLWGYEVAWYDIRSRQDGPGFRVVPRTAELHVGGRVEQERAPGVIQFAFAPEARWFRFFVKTLPTGIDYSIFLLSAPTAGDLELRATAFQKNAVAYFRSADKNSYAAMREIEVNPYIRVRVNGVETDVPVSSTVGQIVKQSPIQHLAVMKPKGTKLFPVNWDHNGKDILNLTLEGGEEIRF